MKQQLEVQWKMSLVSGGWIALTVDLNFAELSEKDRQFILHLLDSVREYEATHYLQPAEKGEDKL